MLYTLNLYSAVCQLYLNKTRRKNTINKFTLKKREYNSGIARWKRYIGQGMGKYFRVSMLCPGAQLSQHLHNFTNLEILWTPSFVVFGGFITKAWLTSNWPVVVKLNLWLLPLPGNQGVKLEVPTLQSQDWLSWQPGPPPP